MRLYQEGIDFDVYPANAETAKGTKVLPRSFSNWLSDSTPLPKRHEFAHLTLPFPLG